MKTGSIQRAPALLAVLVGMLSWLVGAAAPSASTQSIGTISALGPAGVFGAASLPAGVGFPGTAATTIDLRASSVVTASGIGADAGLKVSVSQTTNLVDQNVNVSWTGAKPTVGLPGFAADYLQIMQCWGDSVPDRTQCQFGGKLVTDTRGGENAASRKLTVPSGRYKDPKEPLLQDVTGDQYVPFHPVNGADVVGADTEKNPYYDASTTNEIPFAATRGNGTGFESFEVQTFREAPGLGCGDVIAAGTLKGRIRNCWLVVVPRGETEVDGTGLADVLAQGSHRLDSSPLSTSNWANRIAIPLRFAQAGTVCSIQAKQRPLGGAETAAEAVLHWQPALCRNKGPVFSYAEIADSVVQRKLLGTDPAMGLVTGPVPPALVTSDRILTYAPVAVSGIAVSFLIERQSDPKAPAAVKSLDGERVTDIKLTPRLVAKLLTQSYITDVALRARYLKANPVSVASDPEFLQLNPQFKDLRYTDSIETLVPIGLSDSNAALWRWVVTDQEARDFIAGLPDPWGMRVNPFYQGSPDARADFPKVDPYCENTVTGAPPLCTLDRHPYAQDFHDAARSASRGDALSRINWDVNGNPPAWKKAAPQLNGLRKILAVSDTATAARYGVVTARLRNAAGRFVAPDRAGLSAGLAAMEATDVPGVLASDPTATTRGAYPITQITYAVTAPNILTADAARDYATFIRFAVGAGQRPGTGVGDLPDGYLPLTAALRSRALVVAKEVESRKGPANPSGSTSGGGTAGSTGSSGGAGKATPSPTPSAVPTSAAPTPAITKATLFTPAVKAVFGRYALLIALTLGSCALIAGLLLPRLARRLRE